MEQFNSKLYDKYQNLKKRKLIDEEELSHKRDAALRSYQLEVEELIEELKNENDRLRSEIIELQKKYDESQKLVIEESKNKKQLSDEVGRLQNLLSEKDDHANGVSPKSSYTSPRRSSRNTHKCSSKKTTPNQSITRSKVQYKESTDNPYESCQQEKHVPECCRNNVTGDAMSEDQLTCTFQSLLEYFVSMKFSLKLQADGLCILAIHQRSGYTFTLTWVRHADGRDGEMFYRVSTLGTLERIALDWMKEDMVFSVTMFSVFLERIKRVLGHS
ncbi:uncharacterized protein LOC109849887 isoform X2 [Asparagus officinalis]|uniref:uncharacterized protein LOC109849887 isoform X2 n=1 Tax=Asparagus officinalis TaxID=4686 RepID=UPI00098E1106|nr:uncharacterized protein LOC109849887 isoform X2 [Asparagus officinalis]